MKICPKCEMGNDDHAIQCKDCGSSIVSTGVEYHDYMAEIEAREEKKRRTIIRIHIITLPILGLLYILLLAKSIMNGGGFQALIIGVLLPALAYLNIHHPKGLFILTHAFTIENVDDVELTEFYVICSKIGGLLCLLCGFVLMFIFAFIANFN